MLYRILASAIVILCVATGTATAQSVATITGTLPALVAELTGPDYFLRGPQSDPRPYVDPQPMLGRIYRAARFLDQGEVDRAAQTAASADYEVVRFVDQETRHEYFVMRENLKTVGTVRGWGAYLLNPNSQVPALVEVPHPIDDSNTAKVGAIVFAGGARGLLIAGAQRDKADVPDLIDSVFHQVHVAWSGPWGKVAAWQIHGFAIEKHRFPENAKAILSTGSGEVIEEIVALNDALTSRGLDGYAFNRLEAEDEVNQQVNNGQPGVRFTSLAATKNEQGRHLRSLGGSFVHVELERAVRGDAEQRRIAAEAITKTIAETAAIARTQAETARGSAPREARRATPGRKSA